MVNILDLQPRFVSNFKVAGTKSFRLAAAKFMGEFGGNAQNPAECVLKILRSRKGYKLVQADQSGAEALVVANLAPPGKYLDLFSAGVKPHVFVALHLFALSKPEWFEGIAPAGQFLLAKSASELVSVPSWKVLRKRISESDPEYYIGKRVVHACVPGDTEVLTPDGWRRIDSVGDKQIASFEANTGVVKFETPSKWHCSQYSGELLLFDGASVCQLVTPEHTMPDTNNGLTRGEPAKFTFNRSFNQYKFPKSGLLAGTSGNIARLKLIIAIQADGHLIGYKCKFHIKRQRKIDRLRGLLFGLGI